MVFVLVAGLKYPNASAAIGAAWLLCRVLYLYGYIYSGKPQGKGRLVGSLFWLLQGSLWGLSVFGVGWDLINF
jgi:glutathione S-transferase